MSFINEVATSVKAAETEVEELFGMIQGLVEKAQAAEHQLTLALAGAEQIASFAEQTGIEDDVERAAVLMNEIHESQEYASALSNSWETAQETAEGTKQKLEAVLQFVAEMGGSSQ